MNRREFVKLSGLMSVFSLVTAGVIGYVTKRPVEAAAFGKIYRGTYDGSIHISEDRGQSWQLHSHFGPEYSILDIFTGTDSRLYIRTGFRQYDFHLVLSHNQHAWLSEPLTAAVPPVVNDAS
jgi:hypothetical protein